MLDHLFFTELVGLKVYDLKGRKLGRVRDAAIVPLVDPNRVDRYLLGGGWAWLTIRHDQIQTISLEGIWLRDEQLTPYHRDDYMLRLERDLLDQQIIDVEGRKVVRVTDVTFQRVRLNGHDELRVQEVDIGLRSMFRRLAQGVLPRPLIRRMMAPIPISSIRWEYCNIVESDPQRRLRLNISTTALEALHPADLADIVEELGPSDREAIIGSLDSEVAAEALSEVDPDIQASILESLSEEKAAEIIEEMSPDEAADVLADMEEAKSDAILEEMADEPAHEVEELLEHKEDSAGGLMTTEYVTVRATATVAEAIAVLQGHDYALESTNTVFLIDGEDRLTGAVPLARLLLGEPSSPLAALQNDRLVSVPVKEKQDRVIAAFDKYNLVTLPVVDHTNRLIGVITADDIIAVLRQG
ncbi:MAG: magnesium transporter [Acidobacteria bacterium]|nr:magnesium transporter [Acidobacteriota bacterium]